MMRLKLNINSQKIGLLSRQNRRDPRGELLHWNLPHNRLYSGNYQKEGYPETIEPINITWHV
jgi:hypothetical protein